MGISGREPWASDLLGLKGKQLRSWSVLVARSAEALLFLGGPRSFESIGIPSTRYLASRPEIYHSTNLF